LKILFLIPELGYGGAETALLRLATELASRHTIKLAVFKRTYQVQGYSTPALNVPFPLVELDQGDPKTPNTPLTSIWRWKRRATALIQLKQQHDITISFLSGPNLLNALILCGKPCVISERGSKRYDKDRSPLSRWLWCGILDRIAYWRANRIVCVSEGLSNEVRSSLPPHLHSKVITVAGYLDPGQALAASDAPIEPELLPLAKRPILVSAGRLHPQKGFHYLLPLFAQVATQVSGSGLLLIGDGPQQQQLVAQAQALGLSVSISHGNTPLNANAQVIFLGYRRQPARYTRLGRAFVFSSLYEGLPNLLLEALAAGSWSLAADCPHGPAEVIQNPKLGYLLPPISDPQNSKQWVMALKQALERPAEQRLEAQLRTQLAHQFSIQSTAQRWEDLLQALVA
jgi:glycosyltransferase involved in cell wall biosynthesis